MPGRDPRISLAALAVAATLGLASPARAEVFPASIAFLTLSTASVATDIGLVAATGIDLGRPVPDRTLGRATLGMGIVGALAGLGAVVTGGMMANDACATDPDICDGEDDTTRTWGKIVAVEGAVGIVLGIATAVVGARDAGRPADPWKAALPRPIVMRDRTGGRAPGLAWSLAW